jgi:SAM-dependent methyltransferase
MGKAEWGADPEFFGPRHAHREGRITRRLQHVISAPGLHLECAAGVGSLSISLARKGFSVVSADLSLRSLRILTRRAASVGLGEKVLPVVADITRLPFADATFSSATTAETLEHIADHERAVAELARVLSNGGWLVGTVPAGPQQWSDWDVWAGHLRRFTKGQLTDTLTGAGLEVEVRVWGWPLLRLYDGLFLKGVNRRRLQHGPRPQRRLLPRPQEMASDCGALDLRPRPSLRRCPVGGRPALRRAQTLITATQASRHTAEGS